MELGSGDIDLWITDLNTDDSDEIRFKSVLDLSERERASSFRFDRDRRRFVVGRGRTREILSSYVGITPGALRFDCGRNGKPRLVTSLNGADIRFNLSHSGSVLALCVSVGHDVGVDIELARKEIGDYRELEESVLAPMEQARLPSDPAARQALFLRYWTAKEAYLKARGDGFSVKPNQIVIELPAGPGIPILAESPWGESERERWTFREFNVGEAWPDAIGTLVSTIADPRIQRREI